jgi:hypothetical protein
MDELPELFSSRRPQQEKAREELEAELYQQIGQLKPDQGSQFTSTDFTRLLERRGRTFPIISSFTTPNGRMSRWVTGHRMRLISGRGRPWRRLRRPWFDMAGFEIVAPEASGEAVFSGFALKERHLIWDE